MSYLYLAMAIVAEVVGTSALKAAHGFTRLVPSQVVVASYGVAFYGLSLALATIPVGVAYAIWSGGGIVLVSAIGWIAYGQALAGGEAAGIALILAGTVVIQLFSKSVAR
jgi:small multidrug resistance pump